MTNREWLETRDNEDLAKILNRNSACGFCIENYFNCSMECEKNIQQWLESEVKK